MPGGRPKGSGKGKRGRPDPVNLKKTKVQPCPDLARAGHGADCTICGGTGEYTP
jgi:hypothetical protein